MNISIKYLGENYTLAYNEKSGYYEVELDAKNTGVNTIEVTAVDLLGVTEQKDFVFQILKVVEDFSKYKEKDIAYIFDKKNLKLKDLLKVTSYTIDSDDETNANSTIEFPRYFNAEEKDYILLKKEGDSFFGIFGDLTELKNNENYSAQARDISNIFDESIFLTNENLIKTTGIEDFIAQNIKDYFSDTDDSFCNLAYIEVEVKTHTILQKSVDVDTNGMYNFHTFITNCKQNYNIFMDYKISNDKLLVSIEKRNLDKKFIDCTVADVIDYKKVYGNQITSKVEVMCKDTGNIEVYCLNSDGAIKPITEISIEDRVYGKTERITVEDSTEASQKASDQFKGNDYNYLIEFSLKRDSLLMDVEALKVGTPVKIKTKENQIVNGYITARTENKDNKIVSFKAGKIRRALRQQLKKEMKSN